MENIFAILTLISFIFLIVGIFSPARSLFWYNQDKTRKKSTLIYGGLLIFCFVMFGISTDSKVKAGASDKTSSKISEDVKSEPKLTAVQRDSIRIAEHEADSIFQANKQAADRKEEIEKQFSAWDGAHTNLERYIKKNMNDPDSYEHIETNYWDMKDHLVVMTKFRGKNAFGGKVINTVKAKVDLQGNVIEIIEQL